MRYAIIWIAAALALTCFTPADVRADETKTMEGYIRNVDMKAGTFVLGGKNESHTKFRFGVKQGEREASFYLDGKKASAQNKFPPRSKASVTYSKINDVLWASKVNVTSPEK